MSEVEIMRYVIGGLVSIATAMGATIVGLVIWNAKAIIKKIDELGQELRGYDRRITRLESKSSFRMYASERRPVGGD